jgi:hypothetical protein
MDKSTVLIMVNKSEWVRPEKSEVLVLLGDTQKAKTSSRERIETHAAFSQAPPSHQGTAGYAV